MCPGEPHRTIVEDRMEEADKENNVRDVPQVGDRHRGNKTDRRLFQPKGIMTELPDKKNNKNDAREAECSKLGSGGSLPL